MNSESKAFNITYVNEKGATSSWLFRATAPGMPGNMAVVKVYCVPVPKREGGKVPVCSPVTVLRNMQLYQALGKLTEECGFEDILPQVRVVRRRQRESVKGPPGSEEPGTEPSSCRLPLS